MLPIEIVEVTVENAVLTELTASDAYSVESAAEAEKHIVNISIKHIVKEAAFLKDLLEVNFLSLFMFSPP